MTGAEDPNAGLVLVAAIHGIGLVLTAALVATAGVLLVRFVREELGPPWDRWQAAHERFVSDAAWRSKRVVVPARWDDPSPRPRRTVEDELRDQLGAAIDDGLAAMLAEGRATLVDGKLYQPGPLNLPPMDLRMSPPAPGSLMARLSDPDDVVAGLAARYVREDRVRLLAEQRVRAYRPPWPPRG